MDIIAYGAVTAETVATADGGSVQSAIDGIYGEINGSAYDGEITPLSSCCNDTANKFFYFTGDIDKESTKQRWQLNSCHTISFYLPQLLTKS